LPAPRLATEVCEARVVPAGNVTVELNAGDVTITGDNKGNAVLVTVENNQVLVKGLNNTTVNGSADPFVAVASGDKVTGNLIVLLGGGKDVAVVEQVEVGKVLIVEGEAGNDRMAIRDVEADGIQASVTEGNDQLVIDSATVTNQVVLLGGQTGKNTVLLHEVSAAAFNPLLGGAKDSISIKECSVTGLLAVVTNNGNDVINIEGSNDVSRVKILTGDGTDLVRIRQPISNPHFSAQVELGEGNDTLLLLDAVYTSPPLLDGEGGTNSLFFDPAATTPNGSSQQNFQIEFPDLASAPAKTTKAFAKLETAVTSLQQFFNGLV
jgi:hypothetical protein